MDDENKNGNSLWEIFAPTPPRKHLLLWQHGFVTDMSTTGRKQIFTPRFHKVLSASEPFTKKEEEKQLR